MASTYLSSDVWSDYLPGHILDRNDAGFLVKEAEREVIAHYTRQKEDVRFRVSAIVSKVRDGTEHLRDVERDAAVFLRYYKEDPADLDTSDPQQQRFLDAMRAEIAGVVRHTVSQEDRRQGATSMSQGSKSISFEDGKVARFPPDFGRHLKPFDLRPKSTHI